MTAHTESSSFYCTYSIPAPLPPSLSLSLSYSLLLPTFPLCLDHSLLFKMHRKQKLLCLNVFFANLPFISHSVISPLLSHLPLVACVQHFHLSSLSVVISTRAARPRRGRAYLVPLHSSCWVGRMKRMETRQYVLPPKPFHTPHTHFNATRTQREAACEWCELNPMENQMLDMTVVSCSYKEALHRL